MEDACIAEIIDPVTGRTSPRGQAGELILTTLDRKGSPLLRYRTGDLVQAALEDVCQCGRSELALEGGILGRTDDMVVVRGVNVYPSAVEEIIRACGNVAEYQVRVSTDRAMTELNIQIEPEQSCGDEAALVQKLRKAFESAMALRVDVTALAPGSLPRFEMKARRWIKT
jgi:phenylacetate-CoA ligase